MRLRLLMIFLLFVEATVASNFTEAGYKDEKRRELTLQPFSTQVM
jgi:hypothetical protein